MTTLTVSGFVPGRVRVTSPAPSVDDRDLTDATVVAENIADDIKVAREEQQIRRRTLRRRS